MVLPPLALSLALFALACGDAESPAAAPPPAPAGPPEAAAAESDAAAEVAAAEAAPAPAAAARPLTLPEIGAPGPAFLAVDGKGIARIDDGAVVMIEGAPSSARRLVIGGDGALWAMTLGALHRLDGDAFTAVLSDSYAALESSIEGFAVAPSGEIWVASYKGVARHVDGAWVPVDAPALGDGDDKDSIHGIALDGAGRPLVATTNGLQIREGDAWRAIDLGKARPRDPYFNDLVAGPGATYLVSGYAVLAIVDGGAGVKRVELGGGSLPNYREVSVARDGGVAAANFDRVHVVAADGKRRSVRVKHTVNALGLADGGALWIATAGGVTIQPSAGEAIEWPSGTIPEVAGAIADILVLGSGPARLPGAGPVRTATLTGKLTRDGAAMGGLKVEICPSPAMFMTGRTPCTGAAIRKQGETDADGVWRIDQVPLGDYGLAVKVDGGWQVSLGLSLSNDMKEGEVHDVGELVLKPKKSGK